MTFIFHATFSRTWQKIEKSNSFFRTFFVEINFAQVYKQYDSWRLRARLVCNLLSLNFHYLIFITHHSPLKIPQFLKPPVWHLNSDLVFNFKNCSWVSPKKKIREFVKHCGWVCGFNYKNAIENWVLETENT